MRLSNPRLYLTLFPAAAVLYFSVGVLGGRSPGPISAVHAREERLDGGGNCSSCHGGWFGSMTEACLACHATIDEQIGAGTGLHGALGSSKASACASCHSEHHGAGFAMVNRRSFAQAGVADPAKFDHALVGWRMDGRHLELSCAECHEQADAELLPPGGRRYGGLDRDCASCHEDPHEGRMTVACAGCHGQSSFDALHAEGHERHLPLVGGHGDLSCRACHAGGEPHALETLGAGTAPPARACAQCHASPHAAAFVAGAARASGNPEAGSCVVCHLAEHRSFRDEGLRLTPGQHDYSGFPLAAPHDRATCAQCHAPAAEEFALRYPGRGPDSCRSCHEDPHGGQFDAGRFADRGCVACHDRHRFEPHAFTPEVHARTAFPLTGAHVATACDDCHKIPQEGHPRRFAGTSASCDACHADAHAGFFALSAARRKLEPPDSCSACHLTTDFREIPEAGFDHGRWTGFVVRGAHAQSRCESCHRPREQPDGTGRSFGRVEETFGSVADCASCHVDPHEGGFDGPRAPSSIDGKTSCARCHVETSFRAFPKPFGHALFTGFPLEGAHGAAECAACHTPLRKPEPSGRTWGRARGARCADCHTDVHAGQFTRDEVTDCARCHRAADTFTNLSFRHNLDSRFPLDKTHAAVACASCHKPVREGNATFVRYRPMGRECADCHGQQEDPLRPRGKNGR
ncbi:MAG: hypothetical protein ACT4PV_12190 [Planctomycetaceae bacterium]